MRFLPLEEAFNDPLPTACAPGLLGSSAIAQQTSALCAGLCPEGFRCPTPATVTPAQCTAGAWCGAGTVLPSSCRAGTYGNATNLTRADQCTPCPAGYACPGGSPVPLECKAGQYASPSSAQCVPCPRGTYQEQPGQAACGTCPEGSACVEGAQRAEKCLVGYYLPHRGAASQAECIRCPPFASTADAGTPSLTGCLCDVSYYNGNISGGVECKPCPVGTNCTVRGVELRGLPVSPGYFRPSALTGDVQRCPDAGVGCTSFGERGECLDGTSGCRGGTNVSHQCHRSLIGMTCQLCDSDDAFYVAATARHVAHCETCVSRAGVTLAVVAAVVVLLLSAPWLAALLYRRCPNTARWLAHTSVAYTLPSKIKILFGFYQICVK